MRASGIGSHRSHLDLFVKEVDAGQFLARTNFAAEEVCDRGFNLLPRHARGQHRQGVAQVNHVNHAKAEIIFGDGVRLAFKNPQKLATIGVEFGSPPYQQSS